MGASSPAANPVAALRELSHSFGPAAARRKERALRGVSRTANLDTAALSELQGVLNFMRAYPDNPTVRREVLGLIESLRGRISLLAGDGAEDDLVNTGLPGATQRYSYHYNVLREMVQAFPGCLDVDWDELEEEQEAALCDVLKLCLPPAEADGLGDDRLNLEEWFTLAKSHPGHTDLEILLGLLVGAEHAETVMARLVDRIDVPIRYELDTPGTGRCEVDIPVRRVQYQRSDVTRERFDLEPVIRSPLPVPRPLPVAEGRELMRAAHAALSSRNLEIYPLIHGNPADVMRVACGRGIEVVLVGIRPRFRAALESIYFFLILKNGVPAAYGPAGVFLGACEMGINLFPEFRGAEIRLIYAQLMRVLRHVLGVQYYYLLPYGMGDDNTEALESGAFWFYRKLGFRAANPRVEALAQEEEARMRAEPGHRSGLRMLRRLSHTNAYFDLSGGQCGPFDYGAIGVAVSRFITEQYAGDRGKAEKACSAWLTRELGARPLAKLKASEQLVVGNLAPLLRMLRGVRTWSRADKKALAQAVRAKAGASEAPAARAFARHPRFGPALRELVGPSLVRYPV
ncbi:MAG: hypothetical protein DRJ42_20550 [Deltaproteobacteria bacterium]|nr:MAG: hypothetical protein DRJ42_20550 [Deltaproteobacteria bacterium]